MITLSGNIPMVEKVFIFMARGVVLFRTCHNCRHFLLFEFLLLELVRKCQVKILFKSKLINIPVILSSSGNCYAWRKCINLLSVIYLVSMFFLLKIIFVSIKKEQRKVEIRVRATSLSRHTSLLHFNWSSCNIKINLILMMSK